MASSRPTFFFPFPVLLIAIFLIFNCSSSTQASSLLADERHGEIRRGRLLEMSFRETAEGTNATFDCSPSGPCVACLYSEKSVEKYHCSETGYHIPFKCKEIQHGRKVADNKESKKTRSLLDNSHNEKEIQEILLDPNEHSSIMYRRFLEDSSKSESGKQAYLTYRSCKPAINEERLSVLGFESIMLFLLFVSYSSVYFRRKRAAAMSGAGPVRLPTNSRF